MSRCKIWIMADPDDPDDETHNLLTCYASPQVKRHFVQSVFCQFVCWVGDGWIDTKANPFPHPISLFMCVHRIVVAPGDRGEGPLLFITLARRCSSGLHSARSGTSPSTKQIDADNEGRAFVFCAEFAESWCIFTARLM